MSCQFTNYSLHYRQSWIHTGYNCFSSCQSTHVIPCYHTPSQYSLQITRTHNSLGTQSTTDSLYLDNKLNLCPTLLLFIYAHRQSEKVLEYFTDCHIFLIYTTGYMKILLVQRNVWWACTLTSGKQQEWRVAAGWCNHEPQLQVLVTLLPP
jgi:hypothetical protein